LEEQIDEASRPEDQGDSIGVRVNLSRFAMSSESFRRPLEPQSNIPEEILLMVQRNLFALHSFLEGNPHLFHSATGDYSGARAAPASDQEAWKVNYIHLHLVSQLTDQRFQAEQKSVADLQALLARTIEGVSFFLLLIDHRIGELIGRWVYSFTFIVICCLTEYCIPKSERMPPPRRLSAL